MFIKQGNNQATLQNTSKVLKIPQIVLEIYGKWKFVIRAGYYKKTETVAVIFLKDILNFDILPYGWKKDILALQILTQIKGNSA